MTGTQGPAIVTAAPRTATSMRLGAPPSRCPVQRRARCPRRARRAAPVRRRHCRLPESSGTPIVGPNMRARTVPEPVPVQMCSSSAAPPSGSAASAAKADGPGGSERGEIGELREHLGEADGGDARRMCGGCEGVGRQPHARGERRDGQLRAEIERLWGSDARADDGGAVPQHLRPDRPRALLENQRVADRLPENLAGAGEHVGGADVRVAGEGHLGGGVEDAHPSGMRRNPRAAARRSAPSS